jgi:hypothetical protein
VDWPYNFASMQDDIYVRLGRQLYHELEALDKTDSTSLQNLWEVATALIPLFDKHLPAGFMRELQLWAGVKLDGTEAQGDSYGRSIPKDFPEVFASSSGA